MFRTLRFFPAPYGVSEASDDDLLGSDDDIEEGEGFPTDEENEMRAINDDFDAL